MKKRLIVTLAGLMVVAATASAGTKIGSEVRYKQNDNGTNKYELTLANGSTAITENIDFRFDVDYEIEQDNDNETYKEGWDTDWGFNFKNLYQFSFLGQEWNTGFIYEYDWDSTELSKTDRKTDVGNSVDSDGKKRETKYDNDSKTSRSQHEFKPYFTTSVGDWGVRVSPEYYYNVLADTTYQVIDIQTASALANDWWLATELYNIFNDGDEGYKMDFELYIGKTWSTPVENLNTHFEFGSENYGMFTDKAAKTDIYVTGRLDYTLQAGPTAVVPYIAITEYAGETNGVDYSYSEFGVEFTTKF